MAEGSDTEGWLKIRSRRNEKAQLVRKVALSQQAQTLSEWKGEAWDLFSAVLLVSLFLKLFGENFIYWVIIEYIHILKFKMKLWYQSCHP